MKRSKKAPSKDANASGAEVSEKPAHKGPGVTGPNIELYCKAGADGQSLGDCPFAHYVQVLLREPDGMEGRVFFFLFCVLFTFPFVFLFSSFSCSFFLSCMLFGA